MSKEPGNPRGVFIRNGDKTYDYLKANSFRMLGDGTVILTDSSSVDVVVYRLHEWSSVGFIDHRPTVGINTQKVSEDETLSNA